MAGKISGFFREYVLAFSIVLTILGIFLLFLGIAGIYFIDIPRNLLNLTDDILNWSFYILILGFIVFATGAYYLYSFLKKRKFLLDELKTNKRSELIKNHAELKNAVRHLPSKYHKKLQEKEEELNIK